MSVHAIGRAPATVDVGPRDAVEDRLRSLEHRLAARAGRLLGYPESMRFDHTPLLRFMRFNLDNLGDPYSDLLYGVNSTEFEREVIAWFERRYDLPPEDAWGYVTSSGSEGNLYGLYLGREALPDAVLYHSAATHYSVAKAGRLLRMDARVVACLPDGRIDPAALAEAIRADRGRPAVLCVNLGTTMTGAHDDIGDVVEVLERAGVAYHLHADAALSGMTLPFMAGAPRISFDLPIESVSVSGHKFLGAPFPCGIVVTRREHVARIQTRIPYIGALDATIGGSRNGQAPLYLWHAIHTRGGPDGSGFAEEVATCRDNAVFLYEHLRVLGLDPLLNPHSLTVVFDEPGERLVRRWSLARAGGRAHVVCVPHATHDLLGTFLAELTRDVARRETEGDRR
ncbi:MAG: histidine decarboxylase [Thermoleophilia bacterium]